MAKLTSFDDRIRNQLRDFLGAKRWSVSRFAERYVSLYGEMYSKMEAPGRSTARKLIEDKNHVFSEKEVNVLERMTLFPLVQLWLENQHKVLLTKSSSYENTSDNLDSESLLMWEIRRQSDGGPARTSESLTSVIKRFVIAETTKPLIILTDDRWKSVLTIIKNTLPDAERVSEALLLKQGEDVSVDTIYCFAQDTPPDCVDGGKLFHRSIEIMQRGRVLKHPRHVILVYTATPSEADLIMNQWGSSAYLFRFLPSDELVKSHATPPHEVVDYRAYCLERMRTLPQLFKDEIMAIKIFPEWDNEEECAMFILKLYNEQREWFAPESYFRKPLQKLINSFFPEDWVNDDYDRESLLTAIAEYPEWLRCKEQEFEAAGISVEDDERHHAAMEYMDAVWYFVMHIDTPSLDIEGWHYYFEEAYTRSLMEK